MSKKKKKKNEKKGYVGLEQDMVGKAYDLIEWEFFTKMVKSYFEMCRLRCQSFSPRRGLR